MKNKVLIQRVTALVADERRINIQILELLQEIERRKAYSDLGYDGLFSFCVKELKYSEAQAYRRIQAMRAMSELPILKEKMISGELTVTTVSQVQTHLRRQKRNGVATKKSEKLELFDLMKHRSAKEVELKLQEISGESVGQKLILSLDEEMNAAWESIKNLSAHSTQGQSEAILKMLMREWLQKNDPQAKKIPTRALSTSVKKESPRHTQDLVRPHGERRSVPVAIKRIVWKRDQGKCTHCGSKFALQIDHIQPVAKKGTNDPDNLRLLCRSCNLHAGIRDFGLNQMKRSA